MDSNGESEGMCKQMTEAEAAAAREADRKHNALLKVAPELLEALKRFVKHGSDGCGICAYCKAEAVIAKAEGK